MGLIGKRMVVAVVVVVALVVAERVGEMRIGTNPL